MFDKLNLIIIVVILFFVFPAQAVTLTVRGIVTDNSGTPIATNVSIAELGLPYTKNSSSKKWKVIKSVVSDNNGRYNLEIDSEYSRVLVLSFEYSWGYYLSKEIRLIPGKPNTVVDVVLPTHDKDSVSFQLRLFKDGREISYGNYAIRFVAMGARTKDNYRTLSLDSSSLTMYRYKIFDLPDGEYNAYIAAVNSPSLDSAVTKQLIFTLPILPSEQENQRYLDIQLD
jgi:hypothetical protein